MLDWLRLMGREIYLHTHYYCCYRCYCCGGVVDARIDCVAVGVAVVGVAAVAGACVVLTVPVCHISNHLKSLVM